MAIDSEYQVLVVGGGIGGLATAGFLSGAGLDPVVVESDDALDAPAGPVELWPEATAILSWIGFDGSLGAPVRRWSLRDSDGTVERTLEADGSAGYYAVEYGRLRGHLRDALAVDAVRTDTTVRAFENADDHVVVEFENGVDERFDVVVGADGVRSTTRDAIGGPEARSRGTTSVAVPLDAQPDVDGAIERWTSEGVVLRVVPTGERPWALVTVPTTASDRVALRGRVVECLADTDWLSRGTLPDPRSVVVREDLGADSERVAGRRIALVGDAAGLGHPLAGETTLALEDAAALVGALSDDWKSLPERVAAYGSRRQSRRGTLDGTDGQGSPLQAVVPRVPDRLGTTADRRGTRLASAFSEAPPTPRVENPLSDP